MLLSVICVMLCTVIYVVKLIIQSNEIFTAGKRSSTVLAILAHFQHFCKNRQFVGKQVAVVCSWIMEKQILKLIPDKIAAEPISVHCFTSFCTLWTFILTLSRSWSKNQSRLLGLLSTGTEMWVTVLFGKGNGKLYSSDRKIMRRHLWRRKNNRTP